MNDSGEHNTYTSTYTIAQHIHNRAPHTQSRTSVRGDTNCCGDEPEAGGDVGEEVKTDDVADVVTRAIKSATVAGCRAAEEMMRIVLVSALTA
jgi:hypothetical protein